MGLGHSPSIVLNGLVLALDAANTKSYTGIGTNWTNLIGSGNNGTLVGGPYFNGASGGSIGFDGISHNVSIGTNGFSFGNSAGTLSAWAKTVDTNGTRTIVSYGNAATNQARYLGIGLGDFIFGGYNSPISSFGVSYDTWFNLVGVYNGTQASMYVNGVLVAGPTLQSWNTQANNAGVGKNVNNSEYWKGDISQVFVYNRALSAEEIKKNYNALTGRYASYTPGDDNYTINVSVSPTSTLEDGTTNFVYTFTSNRTVKNNVTIYYTISGTATTNNSDYANINSPVIIPAGSSSATVIVNPTTDGVFETGETVILTLANGSYTIGSSSSATGTILNDDYIINVSVSPTSTLEDGGPNLVYTFTSNEIVNRNLTVYYSISGSPTTDNSDYQLIGTSVTILSGTLSNTVIVNPTTDSSIESDETVTITLVSDPGYVIGNPSFATATIINDDVVPSQVQYTSPGTYSWTCPSGVYSVSAAVVGGGGGGSRSTYSGTSGNSSYFISESVLCAGGGNTGVVLKVVLGLVFPGSGGAGGGVVAGDGGIGGSGGSSPSDSRQGVGGGRAGALLSANLGTNGSPTISSGTGFDGSGAKIDENVTVPNGSDYGFGGAGSRGAGAGGGGAVAWKNNITVVPGQSYTLVVGNGGTAGYDPGQGTAGWGGIGAVRIMWGTGRSYPSTNITNV